MKELIYRRFIQINIYTRGLWTQEFVYFNLSKGFTTCSIESKPVTSNYECKLKVNNLYNNILNKVADLIELNEISDILKVFTKVQFDKEEDWLCDYYNKRNIELYIKDDRNIKFKCSRRAKYTESIFLLIYEYDGMIKVLNILIPKNQKEGIITFNSSFGSDNFILYSLNFRVKCSNS